MLPRALILALVHFLFFSGLYSLGFLPQEKWLLEKISIGWFFVFVFFAFRVYFSVSRLAHLKTMLVLTAIVSLSTVFYNGMDYAFHTFYDTEYRYASGRMQIEQINERRDRRGLPHEVFDKAAVDARYHPQQYLYNCINSTIFNALVVVFIIYPLGLLYHKVRE